MHQFPCVDVVVAIFAGELDPGAHQPALSAATTDDGERSRHISPIRRALSGRKAGVAAPCPGSRLGERDGEKEKRSAAMREQEQGG
jgi:hypothetical protein